MFALRITSVRSLTKTHGVEECSLLTEVVAKLSHSHPGPSGAQNWGIKIPSLCGCISSLKESVSKRRQRCPSATTSPSEDADPVGHLPGELHDGRETHVSVTERGRLLCKFAN